MTQMKIKNLDDLRKLRDASRDLSSARSGGDTVIIVGMGTCGIAAGAREILSEVMAELSRRNLDDVAVQTTGCIGMCQNEPLLDVLKGGQRVTYGNVKPEDVPVIITEHVVNGRVVEKLAIGRAD
ncbi:MAG: (2Fe-2S) ferredoxin domain-containing protein [Aminivibrio sp.]|jgi:NADP-reducing hydrogenase subunit HndB|nr:(2Fe-2S) ferredoxin domain-containing protein [Synergistaceae bacterium]